MSSWKSNWKVFDKQRSPLQEFSIKKSLYNRVVPGTNFISSTTRKHKPIGFPVIWTSWRFLSSGLLDMVLISKLVGDLSGWSSVKKESEMKWSQVLQTHLQFKMVLMGNLDRMSIIKQDGSLFIRHSLLAMTTMGIWELDVLLHGLSSMERMFYLDLFALRNWELEVTILEDWELLISMVLHC